MQRYHVIISFVPGEATEEIAFDVVECFAKEYLKDEYEAVYAVHNDKNHLHAHLIFNSVNLVTSKKKSDPNMILSIHKSQGFDLNYAGVIFGKEIYYDKETH